MYWLVDPFLGVFLDKEATVDCHICSGWLISVRRLQNSRFVGRTLGDDGISYLACNHRTEFVLSWFSKTSNMMGTYDTYNDNNIYFLIHSGWKLILYFDSGNTSSFLPVSSGQHTGVHLPPTPPQIIRLDHANITGFFASSFKTRKAKIQISERIKACQIACCQGNKVVSYL